MALDDGWKIPESTIIVEYIDPRGRGPRLKWKHLGAYLERALERPSVARVRREVEAYEARVAS